MSWLNSSRLLRSFQPTLPDQVANRSSRVAGDRGCIPPSGEWLQHTANKARYVSAPSRIVSLLRYARPRRLRTPPAQCWCVSLSDVGTAQAVGLRAPAARSPGWKQPHCIDCLEFV